MKMKYSYHSERLNDEQNELVQAFYDLSMDNVDYIAEKIHQFEF